MKYMQPVRKMIGKPTILNLVGPLINPYHLTYQMVGVFDPTKLKLVAKTIKDLGRKRAIVLHGANGMDEATLSQSNANTLDQAMNTLRQSIANKDATKASEDYVDANNDKQTAYNNAVAAAETINANSNPEMNPSTITQKQSK